MKRQKKITQYDYKNVGKLFENYIKEVRKRARKVSYNDIFIEDNLPEALGKEELLECLKQAKEGNKEARDKAIIHNIRLVLNQVFIYFYNINI